MPRSARTRTRLAARADRFALYQKAVQAPVVEMDFVDSTFRTLRRRLPRRLREDFCGTAFSACEFVRRRRSNSAVAVDIDPVPLEWGRTHNLPRLSRSARDRLTLVCADVRRPGPRARNMDAVLAMNFSYYIFKSRRELVAYFRSVRRSLRPSGLFFLDYLGGWECYKILRERTRIGRFTYVWDHARFNPISSEMTCFIHFTFADGSRLRRAFSYHWRVWTIREIREALQDAGFRRSTVYWEGDDGNGGGNGDFRPAESGEPCASFVGYIVAEP